MWEVEGGRYEMCNGVIGVVCLMLYVVINNEMECGNNKRVGLDMPLMGVKVHWGNKRECYKVYLDHILVYALRYPKP